MVIGGSCCAGYHGNVTAGTTFTEVMSEWYMPSVTCQPLLPGRQQVMTIIQANLLTVGVRALCLQGSRTPFLIPFAYFPPVDKSPVSLALRVRPGDLVFAIIAIGPSKDFVNATLRDVNTATSVHRIGVVPGSSATAQGFFIGISRGGLGLFTTTFLAKFTAPKFTGCEIIQSGKVVPISNVAFIAGSSMLDGSSKVMALPSALSGSGTIFGIVWVRST
jgi:hypothetical protein